MPQHVNKPTNGMKRGIDNAEFPQDSYQYMLNGYLLSRDEKGFTVINIKGTELSYSFNLGSNAYIIGATQFNGILYVIVYQEADKINPAYIKIYTGDKYSDGTKWINGFGPLLNMIDNDNRIGFKVDASLFGWNKDKFLEVLSRQSYDGSVNIYVVDGENENIVINTGLDEKGVFTNNSYDIDDSKEVYYQQKTIGKIPQVTSSVLNNGNLRPGAYWVYLAYMDEDLNMTSYIKEVGPFYIANDNNGVLDDTTSKLSRSIQLEINNCDTNFKYIKVAYLFYSGEGSTEVREQYLLSRDYLITDNISIIIDGNNSLEDLTLESLLNNFDVGIASTHTQIDGVWYAANIKESISYKNLAKLASSIIPYSSLSDENFNREYVNNNTETSYMPEEIYPFGVSFLINGKYKTDVYPIRGWIENNVGYFSEIKSFFDNATTEEQINNLYSYLNNTNGNNNELGLYCFPDLSIADHFKLLGINFYMKSFWKLYNLLDNKPNITEIYIVQGKREKNTLCQGFSVSGVKGIGFNSNLLLSDDTYGQIKETVKLGSNENQRVFPIIDLSNNLQTFPIIKIEEVGSFITVNGVTTSDRKWVISPSGISELPIINNIDTEENIVSPSDKLDTLFKNQHPEINYIFSEIETENTNDSFCIFSPDLLLDSSIQIPSNIYIKHIARINDTSSEIPILATENDILNDNYILKIPSAEIYAKRSDEELYYMKWSNYKSKRIYNPIKDNYIKYNSDKIYSDKTFSINSNEYGTNNNFSSRMNSLFDVFGDEGFNEIIKLSDDNMQILASKNLIGLDSYMIANRISLLESGIFINRKMHNVDDNISINPHSNINVGFDNNINEGKFGRFKLGGIYIGDDYGTVLSWDNPQSALPLICTNLSMKSLPYIGIKLDISKKYLDTTIIDSYRGLHNSIVNIQKFETIQNYYSYIISQFEVLNENYTIIDNCKSNTEITNSYYKGDIFAQKTIMRPIRWNGLPNDRTMKSSMIDNIVGPDPVPVTYNFDYGWKYGTSIELYLQSTVNTRLRSIGIDKTFYPASKNDNLGWDDDEAKEQFSWKNETDKYANESWTINSGYNKTLSEAFSLTGIDSVIKEKISKKNGNRIIYSNKFISGSIEDAYRQIPTDQYRDFGLENGEIVKLVSYNDILISIQRSGILKHFMGSQLETTDSSTIILGNKELLSDKYQKLSNYGTQHKDSIVVTDKSVYGVDWNKNAIWMISSTPTMTGGMSFGVENMIDKYSILDLFKFIKGDKEFELEQSLYNDVKGIVAGYNDNKKEIYFTFQFGTQFYTLVFNEMMQFFTGFTSYNSKYYMSLDNKSFYVNGKNNIWKIIEDSSTDNRLLIEGEQKSFEITFIINCLSKEQDASRFEKEFQDHLINSCPEEFSKVEWWTEYQYSKKDPFINTNKFWSNPEYKEHNWRFPIEQNELLVPDDRMSFAKDSRMRGQWIKLKLKYTGNKYFYLREIVTNFIASFYN